MVVIVQNAFVAEAKKQQVPRVNYYSKSKTSGLALEKQDPAVHASRNTVAKDGAYGKKNPLGEFD